MIALFCKNLMLMTLLLGNAIFMLASICNYGPAETIWRIFSAAVLAGDCVVLLLAVQAFVRMRRRKKKAAYQHSQESERQKSAEKLREKLIIEKQEEEKKRLQLKRKQEAEYLRLEAEHMRQEQEAKVKIDSIINEYSLGRFVFEKKQVLWSGKQFVCKHACINNEIMSNVKDYRASAQFMYQHAEKLKSKSYRILKRNDFSSMGERLNYLNSNLSELKELLQEINELHTNYRNLRVILPSQDMKICTRLSNTFRMISASEKFVSDNTKRDKLLCKTFPDGLSMFGYKVPPVVLSFENFFFCLFSNVILVFDNEGNFSAALDPPSFSIQVEKQSKYICGVHLNGTEDDQPVVRDVYVGRDSRLIEKGTRDCRWLHTCKNGLPDQRYKYNPMTITYRDTWEYAKITLKIANLSTVFTISSIACADALSEVNQFYSQKNAARVR